MTPTSEERREVAERLRGAHGIMKFVDALGIDVDSDWCWTDVSKRVADLIDPTCHVVTSGEWRGRPIGSACSVCHAPLYPSTEWTHGMRYCSQCGHRVVDDDNE